MMTRQENTNVHLVCTTQRTFLEKAMSVVHPFDSMCPVKDELLRMFFNIVTNGLLWVVLNKDRTLKRWLGYANDLFLVDETSG